MPKGQKTRERIVAEAASLFNQRGFEGFLDLEDFQALLDAMPKHLHLTVLYIYFTGSRMGEVKQITWGMVSKDCEEIHIPKRITKTKDGRSVPLVGPLERIAEALREERENFPKSPSPCSR